MNMVDKNILIDLKKKFEQGSDKAQIEDMQLVFEFLKQIAKEDEEIKEILSDANLEVGIEVTDKDQSFWLKANGTNIEYGDGTAKNPTFIFKTTMLQAAGVIFGDIDPTTAYMAGDITIQGNLQDALAFNDLIIVAIDAFEEIIKDL